MKPAAFFTCMNISTPWINITGIGSVVCNHYSRSTGYRVVLHVFKYRDLVSGQANYGSLGKPVENTLTVAIVNTLPTTAWSSLNLLTAIEERFPTVKEYCEMPFGHL